MAECRLTVRAHVAPWLRVYLLLHRATGWAPSEQHIGRAIERGVRCEVAD